MIDQIRIANIRIPRPNLIARIPKHAIDESRLGRERVDILHEAGHRVPAQRTRWRCAPRRYFRHPERFVGVFGVEGVDVRDDGRGIGVVLMDVVRGEEILAVARRVELIEPVARRIGRGGSDEFGAFPGLADQWRNRARGFLRRHCRRAGRARRAAVGVVRFVEGEHPGWRIGPVDDTDGVRNMGREGHHGDKPCTCLAGGWTVGDGRLEGKPVVGGGDGVEHARVHAAVENDAFHHGRAAGCAGTGGLWGRAGGNGGIGDGLRADGGACRRNA